jgi:hypothetical protein
MRKLVWSTLLLGLAAAALLVPGSAQAASYTPESYAARLLTLFNATRQQHGLAPLALASGTTTVATGWSQRLAAAGQLSHNPNLRTQLESHGSASWTVYGENVGDADTQDPDGLFDAYMASPEHRENVLTKGYRYIGNAVVFAGGRAWNTMDFVDAYSTGTTAAAPKPKAAPAPVKVAAKPVVQPVKTPPLAPAVRGAKTGPLPHSARPAARKTVTAAVAAPRRLTDEQLARPVAAGVVALRLPAPFDTRRILLLAVAAMLALHVAGLWVGVAARPRRRLVGSR